MSKLPERLNLVAIYLLGGVLAAVVVAQVRPSIRAMGQRAPRARSEGRR